MGPQPPGKSGLHYSSLRIRKHIPFLNFKYFFVKFREENVAVKVGHDVCQINQITPGMLQCVLVTNKKKEAYPGHINSTES